MKILTLDELYNFCQINKIHKFSSNETGSQIVISIPAKFEVSDKYTDDSLLFCRVKLMHSGENRNHSSIPDDALYKAGKRLAYKPILANFMEYVDEETGETLKDFTSHDIILNNDGTTTYLEHQIGAFTSDEPYYEIEEDTGHNFMYGYCAIPREYTDAASIIERKNGTKVSVELCVNELEYDVNNKTLELTDFFILGATCLGKDPNTLKDVGEGMLNARIDIVDYSLKNVGIIKDSIKYHRDDKLIELLEKLNETLSNFNINNSKEGGNLGEMKFKELLEKYNKTAEDIDFDYENMSDEELEKKFAELFDDDDTDPADDTNGSDGNDDTDGNDGADDSSDQGDDTGSNDDNNSDDNGSNDDDDQEGNTDEESEVIDGSDEDDAAYLKSHKNQYELTVKFGKKEFAISLQEKIYALYELVNAVYADADNTWYGVTVYDNYVIMEDFCTGKYFKQNYAENDSQFSLVGDRIHVFAEFVTEDELKKLDDMRANYDSLVQFKVEYEKKKFSADNETNKVKIFANVNKTVKESRYGDLFKN